MTSKERVLTTFQFKVLDQVLCWLGASPKFLKKSRKEDKPNSIKEVYIFFGDDFRRVTTSYILKNPNLTKITPFWNRARENRVWFGNKSPVAPCHYG